MSSHVIDNTEALWAVTISAAGGLTAALLPLGEKEWSWTIFAKLIVVGALVGYPTMVIMQHPYFDFLDSVESAVQFVVGFGAFPLMVKLQRVGLARLLAMLYRLRDPAHPPTDER